MQVQKRVFQHTSCSVDLSLSPVSESLSCSKHVRHKCPACCVKTEHDWNVGMNPTSASDWSEVVMVLFVCFFGFPFKAF